MKKDKLKRLTKIISYVVLLAFVIKFFYRIDYENKLDVKIDCDTIIKPSQLAKIDADTCYKYSHKGVDYYRVDYDSTRRLVWFELENVVYDSTLSCLEKMSLDNEHRLWKGNEMIEFKLDSKEKEKIKGLVNVNCMTSRESLRKFKFKKNVFDRFSVVSSEKELVRVDFNMFPDRRLIFTEYRIIDKQGKVLFMVFCESLDWKSLKLKYGS